jgi:hypothetical protein
MTSAPCRLAAALLAALLAGAANSQDKAAAPSAAGKDQGTPQDLEPSVDTSKASGDADSHATGASQATPAPAPARAKAAAKGAAAAADGKPKGNAKDRIELDATQITGNRELPKVLYIVPWKHSDLSDLGGRPANSLLDEVLTPVDRDVFQRENRYYGALQPDEPRTGEHAAGAASQAPPAGRAADAPTTRDEK